MIRGRNDVTDVIHGMSAVQYHLAEFSLFIGFTLISYYSYSTCYAKRTPSVIQTSQFFYQN
jgi:hypothetical protein